jgi:chromosome segregation ATPase
MERQVGGFNSHKRGGFSPKKPSRRIIANEVSELADHINQLTSNVAMLVNQRVVPQTIHELTKESKEPKEPKETIENAFNHTLRIQHLERNFIEALEKINKLSEDVDKLREEVATANTIIGLQNTTIESANAIIAKHETENHKILKQLDELQSYAIILGKK